MVIPYSVDGRERPNAPIHTERHMRIICVGAGASGLCFAYKLQRSFENFSLIIYEKNTKISGTWFENKYPGCACDVPAHNYTWSFEPKYDWSAVYASSSEIFRYFNDFATKYNLNQYIRTSRQVTGAKWNADRGGYDVQVTNFATGKIEADYCDILINASGVLNAWKWPTIPGLEKYQGALLHSANWDESVELEGKHVGLIGNGYIFQASSKSNTKTFRSSGIQILPAIHPKVSKLTTFIRGPTWISTVTGLKQHLYSKQEQEDFLGKPGALTKYRKANEDSHNAAWPTFLRGSQVQADSKAAIVSQMKRNLNNTYLEEKLIPNWSVGCRRITPGINYLETLSANNVDVVFGEITEVTEIGCKCSNGKEYDVDVLICATGFDVSFRPRFPIIGPGPAATNLQDEWAMEAKGYLGLAAAAFPNYMMFLGPNCPVGNGPLLIAIEAQADYMMQFINRWQTENIYSFAPKREAVEDFISHAESLMQKTVWTEDCRSWYKNNSASGRVAALWPGSSLHYVEAIKDVRYDDWDIKYSGNRFAWLGNGYSQTELDDTCDKSYYIREKDDSPYASRAKVRQALTSSGTKNSQSEQNTFFSIDETVA